MSDIKVSIIIPIYNVEPYIADCLQSVMNQNMTEGVECVLVDDCGQDSSIAIAEKKIEEYEGNIIFTILHHEHNKGLSGARNTGIRVAKGEYLYFLDSDDSIMPDCISSMWSMVEKHPDTQVVFSGANVVGSNEYKWMDFTSKHLPEYSDNHEWLLDSMMKRTTLGMTAWNKMVFRLFIINNNLFFEEGFVHEDEIWNLRIAQNVSYASFVRHNTYNYIVRTGSLITSVNDAEVYMQRHMRVWNRMLDYVNGDNTDLQLRRILIFVSEGLSRTKSIHSIYAMIKILFRCLHKSLVEKLKRVKGQICSEPISSQIMKTS